mmetsp:Transcript_19617/g.62421  ORF Transcript_19617/g.62421 Transcript_19617/m.62421 type:complete len:284 (+) Transcript_19617:295-1146(+)
MLHWIHLYIERRCRPLQLYWMRCTRTLPSTSQSRTPMAFPRRSRARRAVLCRSESTKRSAVGAPSWLRARLSDSSGQCRRRYIASSRGRAPSSSSSFPWRSSSRSTAPSVTICASAGPEALPRRLSRRTSLRRPCCRAGCPGGGGERAASASASACKPSTPTLFFPRSRADRERLRPAAHISSETSRSEQPWRQRCSSDPLLCSAAARAGTSASPTLDEERSKTCSEREPASISHRARTPATPYALSASRSSCRAPPCPMACPILATPSPPMPVELRVSLASE